MRTHSIGQHLKRGEFGAAILFLLPNIIGFLGFTLFPIIFALGLSLFKWNLLTPMEFVRFVNFKELMHDPLFWKYLYNTIFLMLGIPISIAGSLLLAMLLGWRGLRGVIFFRTLFYLPTITSGIALFILWRWIYNPDFGLMNRVLSLFGIQGPNWLIDIHWAKPALIIMGLWVSVGGVNMLLYLAGLKNIPLEMYEAAAIDGASHWQQFRYVTWPLLSPTTFFIVIMSIIGGLQGGFETAFILTGGGPAGATKTLGYYIYEKGFVDFQMGYAAGISCILFLIIFILTLIQWRIGQRTVYYQ